MAGNGRERIVDADGHVLEHPSGMLQYMPAKWREQSFHVVAEADGSETVHFLGHRSSGNILAYAGSGGLSPQDRERARLGALKYSEIAPGAHDPKARLEAIATDSIEQAVVYPTLFLAISTLGDPDFCEAQGEAYNRWLADFCSYDPTRLFGVATIVQTDLDRALRMAHHAKKMGLVGVFMRPNPTEKGVFFCDPSWDRLWATLQDLDLTVGFHPYLVPDMPGACRDLGFGDFVAPGATPLLGSTTDEGYLTGTAQMKNIFFSQALSNVYDMQTSIAMLICGGVLERYPRLRCIFLEANGGWIVPFLERLDHHQEIFGFDAPAMKLRPSEYFKRQCWISFDADESTLRFTAESPLCGADRIIWASDYPHPDAKLPGVVGELRAAMKGLPDAAQRRILGLNAVDLYTLPEPRS